jgi:hypothetical protein
MLRYSGKTFSFTKYGGETRELAYMEHHKKIHLNRTFWQFYDLLQQAPNTWKSARARTLVTTDPMSPTNRNNLLSHHPSSCARHVVEFFLLSAICAGQVVLGFNSDKLYGPLQGSSTLDHFHRRWIQHHHSCIHPLTPCYVQLP